jgi:hypothetical protein
MSATGGASWFEFAQAIIGNAQRPRVVPIATAEYPTPARRPAYGVLATRRFEETFGFALGNGANPLRDVSRVRRSERGEARLEERVRERLRRPTTLRPALRKCEVEGREGASGAKPRLEERVRER